MKKILVLCTGNSCRSQMAEGWLKSMLGDLAEVYSAGLEAHGINSYMKSVMEEVGIDVVSTPPIKLVNTRISLSIMLLLFAIMLEIIVLILKIL